ncbi:class I SAM-dependent methyltransferase [Sandaracinobacteroides saxicola]|nr:methyltransferase domain-containing protein [Sandaracinobacteroides saxicola]
MKIMPAGLALVALLLAGSGQTAPPAPQRPGFPAPDRPVSAIVSDQWSDEASRDDAGEASAVMRLLGVKPGMAVADIGAGRGYYVMRLSKAVGPSGRVYAQDIVPAYLARLGQRVAKAKLDNVTLVTGTADDPKLPPGSIDLALMVHMYHEISAPYALLWRLHDALRPGARVGIVDSDRPTDSHGTPPKLLDCEMAAVGYRFVARHALDAATHLSVYAPGERPVPETIRVCKA